MEKYTGFYGSDIFTGLIFDQTEGMYPSALLGYAGDGEFVGGSKTNTLFGYVYEGEITLENKGHIFNLEKGFYFSTVGETRVTGTGKVVFYERYGYRGFFTIGGAVEDRGRLAYIDGCSDSLLISPVRSGDACLNLLVFPPHIEQTMHIHPSVRLGIVAEGSGKCVTPNGEIPLRPGIVFTLDEMSQHSFYTADEGMKIIAYHPDSDTGPNDEDHPMKNRTLTNYKIK